MLFLLPGCRFRAGGSVCRIACRLEATKFSAWSCPLRIRATNLARMQLQPSTSRSSMNQRRIRRRSSFVSCRSSTSTGHAVHQELETPACLPSQLTWRRRRNSETTRFRTTAPTIATAYSALHSAAKRPRWGIPVENSPSHHQSGGDSPDRRSLKLTPSGPPSRAASDRTLHGRQNVLCPDDGFLPAG